MDRPATAHAAHNAQRVLTKLKRAVTDTPDPTRAQAQALEHAYALRTYTESLIAAITKEQRPDKAA